MTLSTSMLIAAALATGSPQAPLDRVTAMLQSEQVVVAGPISAAVERAPSVRQSAKASASEAWMLDGPRRPAALPIMYATLGALQALDVYSTRRAIGAGAREANPLMRSAAGGSGTMLAVKALSTAGTIYFTERAWKKSRKGAIVLMAAINGVTAAIAARNIRNARR